jgi:hypothetical protein
MRTESARMASAREAAFRVPYSNSRPRTARLVALDRASEAFVAHLVRDRPGRIALPLTEVADPVASARGLLATLEATDLVVMISTEGEDSPAASVIAEACRLRRVPVTVFVLDTPERAGELPDRLGHLRPYASMLVRARGLDYVEDMLTALRV